MSCTTYCYIIYKNSIRLYVYSEKTCGTNSWRVIVGSPIGWVLSSASLLFLFSFGKQEMWQNLFVFFFFFFCQVCRKNGQRVSPEFRPSMQRDVFFLYPPVPLDNVRRRERERDSVCHQDEENLLVFFIFPFPTLLFSLVFSNCFVLWNVFRLLQDAIFFFFLLWQQFLRH